MAAPAFAAKGEPRSTTLDACGFFVGTETPSNTRESTVDGVTTKSVRGTWVGVSNNHGGGPVASLGTVKGSYHLETVTSPDGTVNGTETFNSGAGKIEQVFTIGPNFSFFEVTVVATRDLAFLTSSTAEGCYSGVFPRP